MLSALAIKNFAIIDDVQISFKDGFSVLTGETGAGKSIIIEAVNLLLGSRASADLVRAGCDNAELEAFFDIEEQSKTAKLLKTQDIDGSEGLIVRRVISSSGKSRVFINSRQSTLDLLKKVTRDLAGISSQHAHQGLLKEENHLEILDEFADTTLLKNEVKGLYQTIVPLKNKIKELTQSLEAKRKEQDFLEFQINEISSADILPNEDEELEKKRKTLLNASKIFEAVNRSIHEIHDREGSLIEKLSFLKNNMEKLEETEATLEKTVQKLSGTIFDLQDISDELREFSFTIDLDPASLEMTDQRLDLISKLKRKYGPSLEDLFSAYEGMQNRFYQTTGTAEQIKTLEKDVNEILKQISQKAAQLSVLRKNAAKTLSRLAGKELEALEMGNANFEVCFSHQIATGSDDISTPDQKKIGPDGMDKVRFLLSPNPGEALKPLVKIASGGELSRIVLALKAVLSKTRSLETLIFDEVDAGIGGATSEKVGLKLNQLSKKHQLICITHLAQIAKYAENQFRISKNVVNGRTFTTIVPLEQGQARIEEIARMIGGTDITGATLDHARELLEQASS
ncbi:DNA repair protein RecN [Desulfobacula toluolica]|uniref:DNA repair protein RecN n=1 Tax=Desulfobacula toluolica (strain DSM 7467 / Tol2) TaxID=651182 RepID=K0NC98_DESTT|nr:DNA repair protein RecN [Desulfobacula toluolica]CCK82049.1 RecN: DNA repair protein [Desulfobacula toluolica Tol2]